MKSSLCPFLISTHTAFRNAHRDSKQSGMTIIEILIVIALIGTIMTIVISNLLPQVDSSKIDLAKVGASNIGQGLQVYKLQTNRFPSTEEGLKALLEKPANASGWRGPYTDEEKLKDPWQNAYEYELIDPTHFKIISLGGDGIEGTDDDVIYPKLKDDRP